MIPFTGYGFRMLFICTPCLYYFSVSTPCLVPETLSEMELVSPSAAEKAKAYAEFMAAVECNTVTKLVATLQDEFLILPRHLKDPSFPLDRLLKCSFKGVGGGVVKMTVAAAWRVLEIARLSLAPATIRPSTNLSTKNSSMTTPLTFTPIVLTPSPTLEQKAFTVFISARNIVFPWLTENKKDITIGVSPELSVRVLLNSETDWQRGKLGRYKRRRREIWSNMDIEAKKMFTTDPAFLAEGVPPLLLDAMQEAFEKHCWPLIAVWIQGYIYREVPFIATEESIIGSLRAGQDQLARQVHKDE